MGCSVSVRELIYKFDRLALGPLTVDGEANIEYSLDGRWQVVLAVIETAYDADGNEVPWGNARTDADRIALPVFGAITEQCAKFIQSAVDEAIYRRDG